ncbi:MAG: GDSL-type esterase/lipase family protein [Deltaproteobacteria bacterium]|nr:GDSL-type esterase/lipase family protein [Deltaproteobacteria bacterium]
MLVLVAAEFVLRVVFPEPLFTYFYGPSDKVWDEDRELFWTPKDHYASQWTQIENLPADRLAYGLGGSIVMAHHVDEPFYMIAQKCLRGSPAIVNFGTHGFTTHQSLVMLKRALARKKPRLVLVSHGFNDLANAPASDRAMAERNARAATRLLHFMSGSKIFESLRRAVRAATGFDPYGKSDEFNVTRRVPIGAYGANLRAMVRLTADNGIPLVLISQANPDAAIVASLEPYFAVMERVAEAHKNVYYLDVRPEIIGRYTAEFGGLPPHLDDKISPYLYLPGDPCHLNADGHRVVGELLCKFLKEKGLAG